MSLLPFGDLPAYKSRKFVPAKIDWSDWNQIAPLFDALEKRGAECKTVQDFERWLLDGSEFMAAIDEESSRRYIAMTCHTDNAEAEKAYQRALALNHDLTEAHYNLGCLWLEQNKPEAARTELRQILQLRQSRLGAEHPYTKATEEVLASLGE